MHIQVTFINLHTEKISTIQSQSQNINIAEQTKDIDNLMKDEKNKVTINDISYENPFQLIEKKTTVSQQVSTVSTKVKTKDSSQSLDTIQYTISKPKQEKKSLNKKLSPIGNVLKLREELNTEFNNRLKTEKLSDDQIKSYIKSENDLKTKINDGIDFRVIM